MKKKQLKLNEDKTSFILMGKKEERDKAREEISFNPIMCGNFITKEKVMDKWLGD